MYKILELLMIILFGFSLPSITYETIKGSNTICIDPGHGGKDGGCERNGIFEKDINLKLAYHLRDELQSMGYIVEMTRLGDYDLASPKAKIRKIEDVQDITILTDLFKSESFAKSHAQYPVRFNVFNKYSVLATP